MLKGQPNDDFEISKFGIIFILDAKFDTKLKFVNLTLKIILYFRTIFQCNAKF